jgi:hypothetical protein
VRYNPSSPEIKGGLRLTALKLLFRLISRIQTLGQITIHFEIASIGIGFKVVGGAGIKEKFDRANFAWPPHVMDDPLYGEPTMLPGKGFRRLTHKLLCSNR